MTEKEKINKFVDEFLPSDVAGMLKGATRKKIAYLHKKTQTHASAKAIEQQRETLEDRLSRLIEAFPDKRADL